MGDQAQGRLSPFLRKRRVLAALPHLAGSVLDYGCGVGALAEFIPPDRYLGVDIDERSLKMARRLRPDHAFKHVDELGSLQTGFDTIAALAVIEHVIDREGFLVRLGGLLAKGGRIVLTTPHPVTGPLHFAGSRLGLFSREANDEHGDLMASRRMGRLARESGFRIRSNALFMLGMNQLFVLERQ